MIDALRAAIDPPIPDAVKSLRMNGGRPVTVSMQGQIRIEGDIAVLMALQQGGPPTPESERLQERIRALTR